MKISSDLEKTGDHTPSNLGGRWIVVVKQAGGQAGTPVSPYSTKLP